VGTVNMDESTYGFSRKVLDRAFTLEFSDIDLTAWDTDGQAEIPPRRWPVTAWFPRAIQLSDLESLSEEERRLIDQVVEALIEVNKLLIQAQLQVGYRSRDEIALFVLHAQETASLFVTSEGDMVDPLDLALQMKILPRIVGGSNTIRRVVIQLLGWTYQDKPFESEDEAGEVLQAWSSAGHPFALEGAKYPRTAARLCLMWKRLLSEGFTSFWL
jgi:5-methylcytosine-specific restriction protein B